MVSEIPRQVQSLNAMPERDQNLFTRAAGLCNNRRRHGDYTVAIPPLGKYLLGDSSHESKHT